MIKWDEKPTEIERWPQGVNYVLCLDENGGDGVVKNVKKKINKGLEIDISEKFFTLTGCIFEKKEYADFMKRIIELKNKYWENGQAEYIRNKKTFIKQVCFHTWEINNRKGPFYEMGESYELFLNELTEEIKKTNFIIISITINIEEYIRNNYEDNMYNKAMDYMIEQFNSNIPDNEKGLIILEGRGKKEDMDLLLYTKNILLNEGTKFSSSNELSRKIKGIYFNPKWHTDSDQTYIGIELADLVSYPIHKYFKYNKKDRDFLSIENKIYGYPEFIQKGLKLFP